MFLLSDTTEGGRIRACTATAVQALRRHRQMTRDGLLPAVTDIRGRSIALDDLAGRAKAEVQPSSHSLGR